MNEETFTDKLEGKTYVILARYRSNWERVKGIVESMPGYPITAMIQGWAWPK